MQLASNYYLGPSYVLLLVCLIYLCNKEQSSHGWYITASKGWYITASQGWYIAASQMWYIAAKG